MLTNRQAQLLALCLIKDLNWNLIAREAQRPDGLDRLIEGDVHERFPRAKDQQRVLRDGLDRLDELVAEARERAASGFAHGARIITVLDSAYPLNLRQIFNRPPFLFYLGELSAYDDALSVAVVGTREPSPPGVRRARKMASLLAVQDPPVTVLSGLARGVDTAAHDGALEAGGRTVAVIGTGICRTYPAENQRLAEKIAASGAVVSQFWPSTPPTSSNFPRRNVTMSGMGQGTIVVEASATSGAKMQARLALEHGKKVFLVQSLVETHEWARKYVTRGAIAVDGVDDVVARLVSPRSIERDVKEIRKLPLQLA